MRAELRVCKATEILGRSAMKLASTSGMTVKDSKGKDATVRWPCFSLPRSLMKLSSCERPENSRSTWP
ncbi:hypothetical protein DAI43_07780 [Achromobacter xylosoxidans]|nr:hypothetical protein DAI43_07780 [Achromobacter xylosoxidans]